MNISKLDYSAKKNFVAESCAIYKLLKDQEGSNEAFAFNKNHVSNFELILAQLDYMERRVIEHDFIKKLDSQWYATYCSKSTYYKYKHKAIDQFVTLFYK